MGDLPINLMFVGYNRLFSEGLRLLIGTRFDVLKEVGSFEEALKAMQAEDMNVDLVIGDVRSHMSGEFGAISVINHQFPKAKVIVLTPETSQLALDTALQSGVAGVLSNDISARALLYSIEIVLLGERIVPTILPPAGRVAAPTPSSALIVDTDILEADGFLSARERQILHCLVDGLPNKLIARHIGMTESTVKVHLKVLLRKLRIQNRTQAAIWALNHGFFQSDSPQIEQPELDVGSNQELYSDCPDDEERISSG